MVTNERRPLGQALKVPGSDLHKAADGREVDSTGRMAIYTPAGLPTICLARCLHQLAHVIRSGCVSTLSLAPTSQGPIDGSLLRGRCHRPPLTLALNKTTCRTASPALFLQRSVVQSTALHLQSFWCPRPHRALGTMHSRRAAQCSWPTIGALRRGGRAFTNPCSRRKYTPNSVNVHSCIQHCCSYALIVHARADEIHRYLYTMVRWNAQSFQG